MLRTLTVACLAVIAMTIPVRSEELVLYGAGSLREAIGEIASTFGNAHGVAVTTQFGPSGRMGERIEKGEHVDVFTSADIGRARKL
jgi:ABC-type molybdate transport system substrate-binding protein